MEQPANLFPSNRAETRRWIGRIIIAVLLGEALWGLIVSVMNNLVVPWLGDFMGQSAGLPTSFTQRPYNYPDLFVSVLEVGIAGLVAAILNYFFQRPVQPTVRIAKSTVPAAPVGPVRVFPEPVTPAVPSIAAVTQNPRLQSVQNQSAATRAAQDQSGIHQAASSIAPPLPEVKEDPVVSRPLAVVPELPSVDPPAPAPKPVSATPPAPAAAAPEAAKLPPPKAVPAKPKKPKAVYYNIVGEPMPSDED